MFVDRGKVASYMTPDFSFSYGYTLNIIVVDFTGADQGALMAAILLWMRVNQPELLTPNNDAIDFDVDILDNKLVDISLELQLTEQAKAVRNDADDGLDIEFLAEPSPLFDDELAPGDPSNPVVPLGDVDVDAIIK